MVKVLTMLFSYPINIFLIEPNIFLYYFLALDIREYQPYLFSVEKCQPKNSHTVQFKKILPF